MKYLWTVDVDVLSLVETYLPVLGRRADADWVIGVVLVCDFA